MAYKRILETTAPIALRGALPEGVTMRETKNKSARAQEFVLEGPENKRRQIDTLVQLFGIIDDDCEE